MKNNFKDDLKEVNDKKIINAGLIWLKFVEIGALVVGAISFGVAYIQYNTKGEKRD